MFDLRNSFKIGHFASEIATFANWFSLTVTQGPLNVAGMVFFSANQEIRLRSLNNFANH